MGFALGIDTIGIILYNRRRWIFFGLYRCNQGENKTYKKKESGNEGGEHVKTAKFMNKIQKFKHKDASNRYNRDCL